MTPKKQENKEDLQEKSVRILWGSDEDLTSFYANHLYVSHLGETEFHLVFGHLSPPLTIGMEENELPEYLKIKPIAKVVVSPEAMRAFVKLLSDNLGKFEEKRKDGKDE